MSRSHVLLTAVVVAVALGVTGFLAYDLVLRGDAAAPLALPSASAGAAASSGPAASAGPATSFDGVVAGTWKVTTGSQAGYRVRERLANLPAESDAIGRTDKVSGTITLATSGSTTSLAAGTITVDTTSLASDKAQRDNRLRREGLETDRFPTATFKLTRPVQVPAAALAGTTSDVTLTGDLTLHGVTKSVSIPAKARLVNGTVQVAGSIGFALSDYAMTAPNVGGFIVSIADQGALEFVAVFTRG